MHIYCLRSLDEIALYADDWDRLSRGVPFRSWAWLSCWWRAYGDDSSLLIPCVFDEAERLVGLGPWYLAPAAAGGHVVRMLGDGEVCSDYLSILSAPGSENFVADALADYLTDELPRGPDGVRWDLMQLTGIDADDPCVGRFARQMAARGSTVHAEPGPSCWRIELPAHEDEYFAMLSKKRRKEFRRLADEHLDSGRGVVHFVERSSDLPSAMDLFLDMHQRRRQSLGEPGSFASPRFTAFYRDALPAMFREGRAHLAWLEIDGRPVAADYLIHGDGVLYAYQGAIEPDACKLKPGKTLYVALLRRAIGQGYRAFDFLRGDEPYKANFRAAPRPSRLWRIVPRRAAAQLRHGLWLAGKRVKRWLRRGWEEVVSG